MQHEAAWRLPPQGDAEGPQNLHLLHSIASQRPTYTPTSLSHSWHTCRNRFAITGEIGDPCGVPRYRCTIVPSGICIGAANHRFRYKMIHGWSVCACTALRIRSHLTLSKNFATSRSMTQSLFQQRRRHTATASSADRLGRYPSESG